MKRDVIDQTSQMLWTGLLVPFMVDYETEYDHIEVEGNSITVIMKIMKKH